MQPCDTLFLFCQADDYERMKDLISQRLRRSGHKLESGINPLPELQVTFEMLSALNDIIDVDSALTSCCEAILLLQETERNNNIASLTLEKEQVAGTGRPRYVIPIETLEFFIDSSFSIPEMSELLGISVSTVKRRLRDCGLQISSKFTTISNDELEKHVQQIVTDFPEVGYRTVKAHLDAKQIHVAQYRVQEALRNVDPEGVLMRRLHLKAVHRRAYHVRAPLSLWHMDGRAKKIAAFPNEKKKEIVWFILTKKTNILCKFPGSCKRTSTL